MAQCNACVTDVDEDEETHLRVVKPMEFKGSTRKVVHYYCSVECLLETVEG